MITENLGLVMLGMMKNYCRKSYTYDWTWSWNGVQERKKKIDESCVTIDMVNWLREY